MKNKVLKSALLTFILSVVLGLTACGSSEEESVSESTAETEETETTSAIPNTIDTLAVTNDLTSLITSQNPYNDDFVNNIMIFQSDDSLDVTVYLFYHGSASIGQEFSLVRDTVTEYSRAHDYQISSLAIYSEKAYSKYLGWYSTNLDTGTYLDTINDKSNAYISLEALASSDTVSLSLENSQDESTATEPSSTKETEPPESTSTLASANTVTTSNDAPQETQHPQDTTPAETTSSSESVSVQPSNNNVSASNESSPAPDAAPTSPTADTSGQDNNGDNFNTYDNEEQQQTTAEYVLNTKSKKIHHPSCSSVPKIAPENYETSNLSIEELMAQGYTTCGICFK